MKRVLLVTPMMPPTPGGPSTHAKKLIDHFDLPLFNFEKYRKFPSGVRHLLAFFKIFIRAFGKDAILALDGFTVALPSIFVGKILGKKVICRIGGDFVYEQFLHTKQVDLEHFYDNFAAHYKNFPFVLKVKYHVQKFILQNSTELIFNTSWQMKICKKHYKIGGGATRRPQQILHLVENPIELLNQRSFESVILNPEFQDAISSNKYIFTSITRNIPYKNLNRLRIVFNTIGDNFFLDTSQGSWESCLKRISLSRAYICASISDISPNQVQEAISLQVPVIISRYTGITEIVEKMGIGKVIDPFDENDIKKAILEISDELTYKQLKDNYKKIDFKTIWPQTWQTLFEQYEEILRN